MAAPGTKELTRHDSTSKHVLEFWRITTHPAGVQLNAKSGRLHFGFATWSEYIADGSTLQVVISSTKRTATVYATGGKIATADIVLVGDP